MPGPDIEWRAQAVRWWDYWLKGVKTGIMDEPRLTLFVRAGQPPDATQRTTAGTWRSENWPIERTHWQTWYPGTDHRLVDQPSGTAGEDQLRYIAGAARPCPCGGTIRPATWRPTTG